MQTLSIPSCVEYSSLVQSPARQSGCGGEEDGGYNYCILTVSLSKKNKNCKTTEFSPVGPARVTNRMTNTHLYVMGATGGRRHGEPAHPTAVIVLCARACTPYEYNTVVPCHAAITSRDYCMLKRKKNVYFSLVFYRLSRRHSAFSTALAAVSYGT